MLLISSLTKPFVQNVIILSYYKTEHEYRNALEMTGLRMLFVTL